jgi:hypothetical protein
MHATNKRSPDTRLGRGLLNYEQFSQTRCNLRRANENPMFRKVPDQKPGTLRSQDWFDNPDKPRLDH